MSGLGDSQGRFDGLQIPHLPDEDHIGVLAQDMFQRYRETEGIGVYLSLVQDASLVRMDVFNRVLNGYDVGVSLLIDLIDHGCQGGGFAAAGGSGDQEEPLGSPDQFLDHLGEAQLLKPFDLIGYGADGSSDHPPLEKDISPESGQSLYPEGEIEFVFLLKAVFLGIGEHAVGEPLGVGTGQGGKI